MKKLEDCIKKKHVISFLLGQGLPSTNHELVYLCQPSTMSGTIYSHWVQELIQKHNHFLNTDEVQMLIAILLCNNSINHHMHVLCPQTCQKMMTAYNSIEDGNQENLHLAMKTLHKYLDSTHDIMEHKYLAFLFNTGALHWVTMVVVNPSCISMESIASGSDRKSEQSAGGWFFFDSSGMAKNSARMV